MLCFTFLMRTHSGFKYIRPLLCNWKPEGYSRVSGLASFHNNRLCWLQHAPSGQRCQQPLWYRTGNTAVCITEDEEAGYICWEPEKRKPVQKWKWSHLNEVTLTWRSWHSQRINITDGFMNFHSETFNLLFLDLQALRGDAPVVS